MARKSVPPSITEVAFDCPHCGAYTSHTWYQLYANRRSGDSRAPDKPRPDVIEVIKASKDFDDDTKDKFIDHYKNVLRGVVILEKLERTAYPNYSLWNLHVSQCYVCDEIAVWVHERVVFPPSMEGPPPNPDLSEAVLDDYKEASRILSLSPRGAAALLRLAIQKLCCELGEKGNSINDDIATLVENGLSPVVQQALDAVRVIGNEAVHPGTLDLKDDFDTATRLFDLVNLIAEQMISNPKHVKAMYDKLPRGKRDAIDKRDGKA